MSKLLVVFGITGQQGGSVANYVLNSKDLREEYHIRGVSRDTTSPAARSLQQRGVELCEADWSDPSSLTRAVQGAHTVFIVTLLAGFDDKGELREAVYGKMCVDACVAAGVHAIVCSTLPNLIQISGGKYRGAHSFNAKVEVEDYIRQKPIRSAFVAPGRFMQNYVQKMTPKQLQPGGPYLLRDLFSPRDRLPLVDIVTDTGRYVGAILRNFDALQGKTLALAARLYSFEEIAAALSKSSGRQVEYEQVSETAMRPYFPPHMADVFIQAQSCQREFGFYGPNSAELIASAHDMTKVTPTSFDEFLKENKWY